MKGSSPSPAYVTFWAISQTISSTFSSPSSMSSSKSRLLLTSFGVAGLAILDNFRPASLTKTLRIKWSDDRGSEDLGLWGSEDLGPDKKIFYHFCFIKSCSLCLFKSTPGMSIFTSAITLSDNCFYFIFFLRIGGFHQENSSERGQSALHM